MANEINQACPKLIKSVGFPIILVIETLSYITVDTLYNFKMDWSLSYYHRYIIRQKPFRHFHFTKDSRSDFLSWSGEPGFLARAVGVESFCR